MRANTQCTTRGAGDKRGGRGKDQTVEKRERHAEICGRVRDGVGNRGSTRWTPQGLSVRNAGNLKEVGLGCINGGRKDHGFGWGKIRGGGEQLF